MLQSFDEAEFVKNLQSHVDSVERQVEQSVRQVWQQNIILGNFISDNQDMYDNVAGTGLKSDINKILSRSGSFIDFGFTVGTLSVTKDQMGSSLSQQIPPLGG